MNPVEKDCFKSLMKIINPDKHNAADIINNKLSYTNKQLELIQLWQDNKLCRINLLEGSVSSGKTWISLVVWAFWVSQMPKEHLYLMCGKSLTTLKRNCLLLLETLVGEANFTFSLSSKEGRLFGRKILLEGANDVRSESKIRGITLQGAYCDELTLFPEDFLSMLLSRLRVPNAKAFLTTNPDTQYHWLKIQYINRADELNMLCMKFLIDDNTTLDPEYIKSLKSEYQGVFYDRFISGLWVSANGVIYRQFADNTASFLIDSPPKDIIFCTAGLDFGGNGSAHALNLTGFTQGLKQVITLDEWYSKEELTPAMLERRVCDFIKQNLKKHKITDIYCDSAEQVLIRGIKAAFFREKIPVIIHNARKGVIVDRIRFYNRIMAQGRYKIMRHCKHTTEAFSSAVWDSKKLDDVRLDDGKYNIDSLDAQEYSTEKYMSNIIQMGVIN